MPPTSLRNRLCTLMSEQFPWTKWIPLWQLFQRVSG